MSDSSSPQEFYEVSICTYSTTQAVLISHCPKQCGFTLAVTNFIDQTFDQRVPDLH